MSNIICFSCSKKLGDKEVVDGYCRECYLEHKNRKSLEFLIIWDLCWDLPYEIICTDEVIIDPSDNPKMLGISAGPRIPHKLHIIVEAELDEAKIRLRSMANYVIPVLQAHINISNPNYTIEFKETVERIKKIREMRWCTEESLTRDVEITDDVMENIKKIVLR